MISEALKTNNTLTELYLSRDNESSNNIKLLTKLRIRWIDDKIGVDGARMISEALKSNTKLIKLYLDGN